MVDMKLEYIRTLVTALLSVTVLCMAGYDVMVNSNQASVFVGWGGTILGFWFGARVSGMQAPTQSGTPQNGP